MLENFLLAKQHRSTPKNAWSRHRSDTSLHEETWNAANNLCWQFVQDPCHIVFENCRCSWNRRSWPSDLKFFYFRKIFRFILHSTRNVTKGGKGAQFRLPRITVGGQKVTTMSQAFFKTVHLFPKDLRFEHGDAKLTSCPRRHLTSLRPCTMHIPIV